MTALPITSEPKGRPSRASVALAFGGVAFVAIQLIVGFQAGLFPIPGGDELIWDRVGDAVWTGAPIYYRATNPTDSFVYAPPIAVLFSTISWLPVVIQHFALLALRIASLRVIAGTWVGAGIACWFPLVAFELGGGNFNLVIAAGIVAAIHRRPELAVIGAFAKFASGLALDPRDWRRVLNLGILAVAITIPWLHLWPEWASQLILFAGIPFGPQVPISFPVRLAAALVIVAAFRTPWARALAATIAIPAFYWVSTVVFIAPISIVLREGLQRRQRSISEPVS